MVAISISNEKIDNVRSYKSIQRGALPPFESNAYLIAKALLNTKAHSIQNKNIDVFNSDYGLLERPSKMISYLLDGSYCSNNKIPFSKVEFHNYNKNKNPQKPSNVNLYSFFMSSAVKDGLKSVDQEYTIVFTAHHDIVNNSTDNIQDNLASCCHLISLNRRICDHISTGGILHHNIMIAILDEEESGMGGSKALATNLKNMGNYGNIGLILNLELTARGTHYWIDQSYNAASMVFKEAVKSHTASTYANINCPPNDAMPLRSAGYHAACIGTLTRREMKKVLNKTEPYPGIWSICHKQDDKFIYADEHDMNHFTSLLFKIATNEWSEEIQKGILNNKPYGSINYKNKKPSTISNTSTKATSNYTNIQNYSDLVYNDTPSSYSTSRLPVTNNKLIKNGKFDYFTSSELAEEYNYWFNLFQDNLNAKFNKTTLSKPDSSSSLQVKDNLEPNGFFKSNLESRTSLLNLKDFNMSVVEDFMSRGKFISQLDFLLYKEINPTLADFYMKNLRKLNEDTSILKYYHTFYDPNIKHTLDAIRSYCSNEEDFYYMGLLGIIPVSINCKLGMTDSEYFAFISGHVVRIIDCDRDLKTYGHLSKHTQSYSLDFDDIFIELIGSSNGVMSDPNLLSRKFTSDDQFYSFTEDSVWPFVITYISTLLLEDTFDINININFADLKASVLNNTLFKDFNLSSFREMFAYFNECNSYQESTDLVIESYTFNKNLFEMGFKDGQKGGQLLKHTVSSPQFAPERVLGFSLGRVYDNIISYEKSSQDLLEAITSGNTNRCNTFFTEALGIWADSIDEYLIYSAKNNPKNKDLYIYLASLCNLGLAERIKNRYSNHNKSNNTSNMTSTVFSNKPSLSEIKQLNLPIEMCIDSAVDTSIMPTFIEKTFTSLNSLAFKIGKLI